MTARVSTVIGASAARADGALCCLVSCDHFPLHLGIGCTKNWPRGLWEAGQTITVIHTVNDEGNETVKHSGMLVALTMNTNET